MTDFTFSFLFFFPYFLVLLYVRHKTALRFRGIGEGLFLITVAAGPCSSFRRSVAVIFSIAISRKRKTSDVLIFVVGTISRVKQGSAAFELPFLYLSSIITFLHRVYRRTLSQCQGSFLSTRIRVPHVHPSLHQGFESIKRCCLLFRDMIMRCDKSGRLGILTTASFA